MKLTNLTSTKTSTNPLTGSTAAKNYISSLTAGGQSRVIPNTVAAPKPVAKTSSPVVASNLAATSPSTPKITTAGASYTPSAPAGWDSTTYSNFKKANPTLEPDAEDTYRMQNADNLNKAQSISTPTENPRDAYVKYLSQYLAPTQQESESRMNLAKIQNEEEARRVKLARDQEMLDDAIGGTRGGAIESVNKAGVRGNRELADIAVRKGAEANLLSALTGNRQAQLEGAKPLEFGNEFIDPVTGKTIYSKPQAGFELGKDQTRYEINPKTGKYEQVAVGTSSGVDSQSNELLTPTEASSLGVPYGTTRGQAFGTSTVKPLSGEASKLLSITETVQPEIAALKKAFTDNYRGSLLGITTGTNRELVKLVDQVADKVGRLRSGGAVNTDEANRFKNQIASFMDIPFGNSQQALNALDGILAEASSVATSIRGSTGGQTTQSGTGWADL